MSRHLWNLERLCKKLQSRFGDDDALTMQIMHEIASLQVIEAKHPTRPISHLERFEPITAERRRTAESANPT